MPELPEVETVVRTLEQLIQDRCIVHVEILWNKIIAGDCDDFIQQVTGQHFRHFSRRGKYLLFYLDDVLLVGHLRMEGKFYVSLPEEPRDKHVHFVFTLDDGRELRYHDIRKFGRFELMPFTTDLTHFKRLGPEPFSDEFTPDYIYNYAHKKSITLKQLLLEQSFAAGIGNIYANEICFAMKVHPTIPTYRLTKEDCLHCQEATRSILRKAIAAGGTTIRSYTSSLGVTGLFQLEIEVHSRKGEACHVCGSEIMKTTVGGRGTYFCPVCQKRKGRKRK